MVSALRLVRPAQDGWSVPVLTCSGLTGEGLEALWAALVGHRQAEEASGALAERRERQRVRWMWANVEEEVLRRVREDPAVRALAPEL